MPTRSTNTPELLATPDDLRRWSLDCRGAGLSVGMVPTMGALHAGHRSLIDRAVAENDRVVVTIFVNPAQFGPNEDFARYPRTMDADLAMLADAGVHAAFVPSVETMYPPGLVTRIDITGSLGERLEGASRPGHFNGVALVVTKLLVAGLPHRAYFGQKDAQQCAVVSHLVRDLDVGVEIVVCPTVRDTDGLAISSRNRLPQPRRSSARNGHSIEPGLGNRPIRGRRARCDSAGNNCSVGSGNRGTGRGLRRRGKGG